MTIDPLPIDVSIVVDALLHSEYHETSSVSGRDQALLMREDRQHRSRGERYPRTRAAGALRDVAETTPPETKPAETGDRAGFDGVARALLQHAAWTTTRRDRADRRLRRVQLHQSAGPVRHRPALGCQDARAATEGFRGRYVRSRQARRRS